MRMFNNVDQETGEIRKRALRTRYNTDFDHVSRETSLFCQEPTRAQQQFKEECDINTIVKNFGLTGEMPSNVRMPLSADFVETTSYQEALNQLIAADEAFLQYPAELRARFENDPGKFVEYVSDPKNVEDARKWGLARPLDAAPEPFMVRVVPDPVDGPGGPAQSST